ncbi:Uncharacterized protein OS=Blastopirellula marina DSM 3645 GN=DSM3645_05800 PE=4 SV=1 [Gemmataceae bacterium]|nr:Uncharacterized protein OS=Blastopirellula marina DSM 3645 GN=DSM3645_05800 PE=4 SV=1 [Gemmataceae bacterium]VTU01169.1 Uncharacterized protein OS=Blastopirellula marina DSM 3645 GN=DSM3645_05800 PE=4 SV=1 [Gemmataceae bacterium]
MPDDRDPDTDSLAPSDPAARPDPVAAARSGCLKLFLGFLFADVVGFALAAWVLIAQGPGWLVPLAFVGPGAMFLLVFGGAEIPRLIRQAREAVAAAPSPESAAAVAAGEGVEAGTAARPRTAGREAGDAHPTVAVADTEPGTVLAYRLKPVGVPWGCQFGCLVVAALFWNGILSTFVVNVVRGWNRGGLIRWGELLFLSPFLLVGLAIIAAALYAGLNWIVSSLVGRVVAELSDHPLAPGAAGRVHVAQGGIVPLGRVTVWLVCTEEATYVAGTSKSTAKKEVEKHPVADPEATGGSLPLTAEFAVPRDAMHTFHAPNNKIAWTVRVTGRALGVLPYRADFGFTVSPE